ncbi:MAG TPA: serine/threonine-protein kinase [Kofleriaceae bacterium]|nr:serine/threonine-protein kinase [Kofleriaceae bacterium]
MAAPRHHSLRARPDLTGETLPFAPHGRSDGTVREVVVTDSGATIGLAPGSHVGDWRIDGKIGEGGMGSVHAATHPVIGKRAAIKVVRAEMLRSPGMAERFVQEARAANQIDHPSVVDIFDIGQLADGRPYLVMELLRGRTLGERMEQGRMSPLEAIDVLLQIADALVAAHAHGVVHRDLKPDNIYLNDAPSGATAVKIVDWGIAKLRDDATPRSMSLTTSGVILGTPQYVSPEQARGKSLDERSDIYSLGVIAYEMFLEGPPFVAESVADMVAMHLREPPPPPSDVWPDIPPQLEALLLAMLAKDVAGRPALTAIMDTLRAVRALFALRTTQTRRERRIATGSLPPPMSATVGAGTGEQTAISAVDLSRPTRAPRSTLRWALFGGGVALAAAGVLVAATLSGRSRTSSSRAVAPARGALEDATAVVREPVAPAPPATAAPVPAAPVPSLSLEVRGAPKGARVWIDATPATSRSGLVSGTVPPGRHVVRVEATGYESYRRELDVRAATVLDIELTKLSRSRGKRAHARTEASREETPKAPAQPSPAPERKIDPNGTIESF